MQSTKPRNNESLAIAYATKRRSKVAAPKIAEPVEEAWEDLPELDEPIEELTEEPGIDIAAIIKKHRFFASKKNED